jgi:hypothetical protein
MIEEWRTSQRRVSELEREYAEAMQAYYSGEGPVPPDEMKERILELRVQANMLLNRALTDIDRRMLHAERKSER